MAFELSVRTAADWLRDHGISEPDFTFTSLGGGVSNEVILADSKVWRGVLKQSLGKLRVEKEWLSDRERISREAAAMRWLGGKLQGGRAPRVLLEDARSFTIAMEAAPDGARMWKELLFAGTFEPAHARGIGKMLASMISLSFRNPDAERLFGDQNVFRQLRIDPYYRFTASRHPELAIWFSDLIERSASRRVSLVHGDWSPKNLLIAPDTQDIWAIDWEVIHFGDPSFDAGFLLNHLVLKRIALPQHAAQLSSLGSEFMEGLRQNLPAGAEWIPDAALEHLPGLLLARVDGKSPAEYLNNAMRSEARDLALGAIRAGSLPLAEFFRR